MNQMKATSIMYRLLVPGLCLLLIACSATRHSVSTPQNAQELSRFALVIKEGPGGEVSHSWEPLSTIDLPQSTYQEMERRMQSPVTRVSWTRDCDEENVACIKMCKKSLRGRNWSHASPSSKDEICQGRCRQAYLDCCRLREQSGTLKFQAADDAVAWLKRHREEILVGTVVVIAGVAFAVAVAGSGGAALLLVPAVMLASSHVPTEAAPTAVMP